MAWTTTTTRASGFTVTAAVWNDELVENMQHLEEVAYQEFASDVPVTATSVGTANQIVSAGAITYEAVPHDLRFYCPAVGSAAVTLNVILRDGTTVIGTLSTRAASFPTSDMTLLGRFTPTAASHTYNIAAWLSGAGTWTFNAGTGGTAGDTSTHLAGFLRITRAAT